MRKLIHFVVGTLLMVALVPAPATAQGKVRIAIWDFDNNAERSYWYHDDLGPAARNQIDTAFSQNKTLSDLFTVVERDKLALVMKEQGLATAGALDPQTAAKVGKLLGVRYIVTGAIDKFAVNKTGAAIGRLGVGGNVVTGTASIKSGSSIPPRPSGSCRSRPTAEVRKGGGFFKGTSVSRDAEWGLAERDDREGVAGRGGGTGRTANAGAHQDRRRPGRYCRRTGSQDRQSRRHPRVLDGWRLLPASRSATSS